MSRPPFTWDAPVDLIQIWPAAGYRDTAEQMTMRQAVDAFLRLPEEAQRCCAIEPVEPYEEDGVVIAVLSFDQIGSLQARAKGQSEEEARCEDNECPKRH